MVIWLLTLVAISPVLGGTQQPQPRAAGLDQRTPEQLVQQLGADTFVARERATVALIGLGELAEPALQKATTSSDREIRFRSSRLLKLIREQTFEKRLLAFVDSRDPDRDFGLPAWTIYRGQVGDSPAARELFVAMQREEPQLMQAIQNGPKEIATVMPARVLQIQSWMQFGGSRTSLSLGSVAALLFALVQPELVLPTTEGQLVVGFFHQASLRDALADGQPLRVPLRHLLGTWIRASQGLESYRAMLFALQNDLDDALVPAVRILRNKEQQEQPNYRQFAILTLARFGNESHIPLVLPLLDDETEFGGTFRINQQVAYQTQIRDIALATVIRLAGQNPQEYGFERLQENTIFVFNTSTLAFSNDQLRQEAIHKWRIYWTARRSG